MPRKPKPPKPKRKKMDLIDRFSGEVDRTRKINSHRWIGVQRLYALGEWTRVQVGAEFDIIGHVDEERQATQIADRIDSFTGNNAAFNKLVYIGRVEAVVYCIESFDDLLYHNIDSTVNKAKVFEDMQIIG